MVHQFLHQWEAILMDKNPMNKSLKYLPRKFSKEKGKEHDLHI